MPQVLSQVRSIGRTTKRGDTISQHIYNDGMRCTIGYDRCGFVGVWYCKCSPKGHSDNEQCPHVAMAIASIANGKV